MALAARAMLAKPSKNKVYDVGYAVEDELGVHGQGSFCQPADQPLMQMDRCQSRDVFGLVANEPAELLKTQHKFYLDPKTKFRRKWDVIMLWLLVFTAIATPFEVAVLDPEKGTQFFWVLFSINFVVNTLFIVDMVMNFFLAYQDEKRGELITNRKQIVKAYVFGWFPIDFISVVPFDLANVFGDDDNKSAVADLKILKVIRLLRLIKLLRIMRASRVMKRLENQIGLSFRAISLLKFLTMIIILVHWIACLWNLIPGLQGDLDRVDECCNSWADGEDAGPDCPYTWLCHLHERTEGRFDYTDPMQKYVRGFEFAILAIGVGYGHTVPQTVMEQVTAIFCILIFGSVYAYVLGSICGIVSNIDPALAEYRQKMDHLNAFMAEIYLPQEMRARYRDYFQNIRHLLRQRHYDHLLEDMSPRLREDIANYQHGGWVSQVTFFCCGDDDEEHRFVTKIALNLGLDSFASKEYIFTKGERADRLYIVQRGLIGCRGRVLNAGRIFGEEMILYDARRTYEVYVLVFVNVYFLSQQSLRKILDSSAFARTERTIRAAAIRMSLRMEIKLMSRLRKGDSGYTPMTKAQLAYWKEYYLQVARKQTKPKQNHPKSMGVASAPFDIKRFYAFKAEALQTNRKTAISNTGRGPPTPLARSLSGTTPALATTVNSNSPGWKGQKNNSVIKIKTSTKDLDMDIDMNHDSEPNTPLDIEGPPLSSEETFSREDLANFNFNISEAHDRNQEAWESTGIKIEKLQSQMAVISSHSAAPKAVVDTRMDDLQLQINSIEMQIRSVIQLLQTQVAEAAIANELYRKPLDEALLADAHIAITAPTSTMDARATASPGADTKQMSLPKGVPPKGPKL